MSSERETCDLTALALMLCSAESCHARIGRQVVLAFFLFVVVGSSLLQIIRQAQSGSIEG
jgi:hypothetical protein